MESIKKSEGISLNETVGAEELERVNRFAKRELKAEEVYCFAVKLCDNEIDRDGERFPTKTLEELATLFVGKSGIFDHQWSAQSQTARLYRTEVVREEENYTAAGETYAYLKGYAYMLRNEKTLPLIQEIEAGIKKEVSVGCSVRRRVCSICGEEKHSGRCGHENGTWYEGKLCCTELVEASDAYEFSFVAVPAQPRAGVMRKSRRGGREMETLEKQAALGRKYLERLQSEVVSLGGLAEPELKMSTLRAMAEGLEEEALLELREVYAKRAGGAAGRCQLPRVGGSQGQEGRDAAFLI